MAYTEPAESAIDKAASCENSAALCTKNVDQTMSTVRCLIIGCWGEFVRSEASASTMERTRWTDERIDDRMTAMDEKWDRQSEELQSLSAEMRAEFSAVRAEATELRVEMQAGFSGLRAEMTGLRADMQSGFSDLRAETAATRADLWSLQRQVVTIVGAIAVGVIGLLGALVAAKF